MTNLLTNSGFDNNATSWIRFGSTEYVTGPDARSNQTCIKMIANPLGNESTISGIRQFFTAEPGKSYVLSFWGKGTKDLRINWSWRFTNAQNSWWGYGYNSGMLVEADESSYRRFTHQFIFPADMLSKSREEYPNYLPYVGNWIYYRNVGSNDSVSHVGLVVKGPTSSSNKIECVEGNLGSASNPTSLPVRRITIDDYTAQTVTVRGQEKYILGFAPIIYM